MAAEIHFAIAGGVILILLWAIVIVLFLIGLLRRDNLLRSIGLVMLGLMAFASPMTYYLEKASSSWSPFIPTVTDLVILGVCSLLGGVLCTLGALTYKRRDVTPKAR
jgi:hypothetical protein